MGGCIILVEDAWLYHMWKTKVDVDSLSLATLPSCLDDGELDSYEPFILDGRVSELSNAATPGRDDVVLVLASLSMIAKPLDAGIFEGDDIAIAVAPAQMATRRMPVDASNPLVVGDSLSDTDILAWQDDKLYHNVVEHPRAWTMAVTYIASWLKMMTKYKDSKGNNHTTMG